VKVPLASLRNFPTHDRRSAIHKPSLPTARDLFLSLYIPRLEVDCWNTASHAQGQFLQLPLQPVSHTLLLASTPHVTASGHVNVLRGGTSRKNIWVAAFLHFLEENPARRHLPVRYQHILGYHDQLSVAAPCHPSQLRTSGQPQAGDEIGPLFALAAGLIDVCEPDCAAISPIHSLCL
jgi:hypothetical protein